jgi:hypothetical protein
MTASFFATAASRLEVLKPNLYGPAAAGLSNAVRHYGTRSGLSPKPPASAPKPTPE